MWTWEDFRSLPTETVTVDIDCVTKWSKLDTVWQGVSVDTLLAGVDATSGYAYVQSYGGYTTNLPLEDLTGGKAWVASSYNGAELPLSTVARPGCWCHTSISGRVPSGCTG